MNSLTLTVIIKMHYCMPLYYIACYRVVYCRVRSWHHTIDRLEEGGRVGGRGGVEKAGGGQRSTLIPWDRAVVMQYQQATLEPSLTGKIGKDLWLSRWVFLQCCGRWSHLELNWANCSVWNCIVLSCIVLSCIALSCIVLYCFVLYCIVL